jgi:thiamine biosynthesis lipoprotein
MTADSAAFPVWGTTAWIAVTEHRRLPAARAVLDARLAAVGAACDRFRADSELSRLNAAAGRPVRVSALLAAVLDEALRVARATDGTVDPTVGAALLAAGYDRDLAEVRRDPRPARPPVPATGWRGVVLDGNVVTTPPGTRLDLGAVAKAYAADRAARHAAGAAGCGVLVALGGDIAVCGPPPEGGWRVRVAEDHRAGPDAACQYVTVEAGGLATSSVTVRRWDGPGTAQAHHIVDPATGAPVEPHWRTASVAAATCVDANAAATSAIVRGAGAAAWLSGEGLPARLVAADGAVVTVGGWPAAHDTAAAP